MEGTHMLLLSPTNTTSKGVERCLLLSGSKQVCIKKVSKYVRYLIQIHVVGIALSSN